MWSGVSGLLEEIARCEKAGAITASISMAYIAIDTMSFLSLPSDREVHYRADFIEWVEKYLKADSSQLYNYRGIDVYGARCALLHAFGSGSDFHVKFPDAKIYGYHDGGKHGYDPNLKDKLVLIGVPSFLNDLRKAIAKFIEDCIGDADLLKRVEARLPKVLVVFPFSP